MKRAISQEKESDLRARVERINTLRADWKIAVAALRCEPPIDIAIVDRAHEAYADECHMLYFALDHLFNGDAESAR